MTACGIAFFFKKKCVKSLCPLYVLSNLDRGFGRTEEQKECDGFWHHILKGHWHLTHFFTALGTDIWRIFWRLLASHSETALTFRKGTDIWRIFLFYFWGFRQEFHAREEEIRDRQERFRWQQEEFARRHGTGQRQRREYDGRWGYNAGSPPPL